MIPRIVIIGTVTSALAWCGLAACVGLDTALITAAIFATVAVLIAAATLRPSHSNSPDNSDRNRGEGLGARVIEHGEGV